MFGEGPMVLFETGYCSTNGPQAVMGGSQDGACIVKICERSIICCAKVYTSKRLLVEVSQSKWQLCVGTSVPKNTSLSQRLKKWLKCRDNISGFVVIPMA